jgi:hypothetical protein
MFGASQDRARQLAGRHRRDRQISASSNKSRASSGSMPLPSSVKSSTRSSPQSGLPSPPSHPTDRAPLPGVSFSYGFLPQYITGCDPSQRRVVSQPQYIPSPGGYPSYSSQYNVPPAGGYPVQHRRISSPYSQSMHDKVLAEQFRDWQPYTTVPVTSPTTNLYHSTIPRPHLPQGMSSTGGMISPVAMPMPPQYDAYGSDGVAEFSSRVPMNSLPEALRRSSTPNLTTTHPAPINSNGSVHMRRFIP